MAQVIVYKAVSCRITSDHTRIYMCNTQYHAALQNITTIWTDYYFVRKKKEKLAKMYFPIYVFLCVNIVVIMYSLPEKCTLFNVLFLAKRKPNHRFKMDFLIEKNASLLIQTHENNATHRVCCRILEMKLLNRNISQ